LQKLWNNPSNTPVNIEDNLTSVIGSSNVTMDLLELGNSCTLSTLIHLTAYVVIPFGKGAVSV